MGNKNELSALSEFYSEGAVEKIGEKNVLRFKAPRDYQGHTIAMDILGKNKEEFVQSGPFRIEYALGSNFIIHNHDLSSVDLDSGFSNLRITGRMAEKKDIVIIYAWPNQKAEPNEAQIEFKDK